MVPVPFHVTDWVAYHEMVGNNYAGALKANGVKKVVNLGTYGGHRTDGIGPTASIARVEKHWKLYTTQRLYCCVPAIFILIFITKFQR
jgi:hypothetical protein